MPDAEGTTPDSQMRKRKHEDEDTNDDDDDDEEDAETNGENDSDDDDEEEEDETQVEEVGVEVKEAEDFVAWCRGDGQSGDYQKRVDEALRKLKNTPSPPHHFSWRDPSLRCDGCKDDHDACERCKGTGACSQLNCPECQLGKWARYANKLRLKASVCAINEKVYDIIEGNKKNEGLCGGWDKVREKMFWSDRCWSWNVDENCTCASCLRAAPKLITPFLYREKLVRKIPWFEDADFTLKPDGSLPDVLQRAVDHWVDFFSELQEHAYRYADKPHARISREDSDLQELIKKIPPSLLDKGTRYMDRDCHCTIAALNELRRRRSMTTAKEHNTRRSLEAFEKLCSLIQEKVRQAQGVQQGTRIQEFKEDFELYNFEGTEEDHYCLGSRGPISDFDNGDGEFSVMSTGGATKWYIGTTNDQFRRHKEHDGKDPRTESRSSSFVRLMTNRTGTPDGFGGWKVDGKPREEKEEAFWVESSVFTRLDEDNRTEHMSMVFGQRHVRGGIYTSSKYNSPWSVVLEIKRRHFLNRCFKCGGQHFSTDCKEPEPDYIYKEWNGNPIIAAHIQSADDDEALSTWKGLNVAYEDHNPDEETDHERRRTANFQRARKVAKAFCDSHDAICRAVMLSSANEEVGTDAEDEVEDEKETTWYKLVKAIWPPPLPLPHAAQPDDGIAGRLRRAQKKALRMVCRSPDNRNRASLVLCLPTAYGKTRIFLTAAVHEVLYGRGKAVIFLPYMALMADISRTFQEISEGLMGSTSRNRRIVTYDTDSRVRGSATAYGGSMYVLNPATNKLRKITWTRWQGHSGDGNMRQHEQSEEFKNADIVLATPDKWMLPASGKGKCAQACDSFLRAFEKQATDFGLAVVDEAHQFSGVLGGSMRELLRRMKLLCEHGETQPSTSFRVILASATIPDPEGFAKDLLPEELVPHVVEAEEKPTTRVEIMEAAEDPVDMLDGADSNEPNARHLLDEMLDKAEENPDGRHRLLLFHEGKLGITEVCNNLLTHDALGKNDVRRVLLFCDSKQLAARFVERLRTKRFKEKAGWDANGFDVFATPYHGDCAKMHRRIYERLFGGWVRDKTSTAPTSSQRRQLHIIVATSALEAGVNICGPDVIIVLDAATCSRDSLVQRIGRGGRVGGRPAVVVIGVDPTELPEFFYDADMFRESGGERRAIERYLLDDGVKPPPVVKTRAMRVHGARQHVRNLQKLEKLNGTGLRHHDGRADLKKLLDDFNAKDGVSLAQIEEDLGVEGERETPFFGHNHSARGMGLSTITLRKVTREGHIERPYGPRNDEERPVPNAFVEVAALDVLRALKFAHPQAHYMSPHGTICRVYSHVWKTGDGDNWLSKLKAVYVYPVSRAAGDEHYYCITKSTWNVELSYDDARADSKEYRDDKRSELSRGKFTWEMKWESFSYVSKFNNDEVEGPIDPSDILSEGANFLKPARRELGGWQWLVHVDSADLHDNRNLVRLELWLRFAEELGCAVQQIEVQILDEKDESSKAEDVCEINDQNTSPELTSTDEPNQSVALKNIRLQMVEHATIGLPSEALRRMPDVLNDRGGKLLLEDRTWSKRLYDQEPHDEKVDPDKIQNAINHLLERWVRAYPNGWKLDRR